MTFTRAPRGRCTPGRGFCDSTRPRLIVGECTQRFVPRAQWCRASARLAPRTVLPRSAGTTHSTGGDRGATGGGGGGGGGGTAAGRASVTDALAVTPPRLTVTLP